jgi:TPR repeat protein
MLFFLLSLACTKTKYFTITIPAEIAIDQSVKNVAPLNRESSDESQKVMNELIRNMTDARSPRFLFADQKRSQAAYTASRAQEGEVLSKSETEKICSKANVNGILALEKFRYDKDWDFSTYKTEKEKRQTVTEDGKEREQIIKEEITMHRAVFSLMMHGDWKIYSCSGEILDSKRTSVNADWSGEGESRSDAKTMVGETDELTEQTAISIGNTYFRRISPYEISVQRKYYPDGHKKIKLGNEALDNGDYKTAERLFREAIEESVKKNKGKALYNLALVLEITDNIDDALEKALKAHNLLQNDMSQNYVEILRKRKADADELKKQLGQ